MQPHLRKCFENIARVGDWVWGSGLGSQGQEHWDSFPRRTVLLLPKVLLAGNEVANEIPGPRRYTWGLWEEGQLQNPQLRAGGPLAPSSSRGPLFPQYTEVLAG